MKTTIILILSLLMAIVTGCGGQSVSDEENQRPSVSLNIAALQGNVVAVKQHVNAGSDLNKKDEYGSPPLSIAITFGKDEAAMALIDAGVDLNITNNDGSTPLHIAAFFCRTEIVKALLEKGADKTLKNNYGNTAYESVAAPFEAVKPFYDAMDSSLKPLGLNLDYDRLEKTRPIIAEMLK